MFSFKKAGTPEGWMTKRHERIDYGMYMCGQNIIYHFIRTSLTTYLLMCGINPISSAGVMMLVKVWDAVNDALFGGIFDKIKFKNKTKFMPWIRISLIFIPVGTILMFAIPEPLSESKKLLWFALAYIFWDSAYTLCDVPLYGMVTTMTNNLHERTSIMSYSKIYGSVGYGVAMLLGNVLISQKVGLTFTQTAVVGSAVALATMLPMSIRGKERNYTAKDQEQNFTFKEMFRYLISNKYLLIYFLGYFIADSLQTGVSLSLFVSYYLFENELFNLVINAIGAVPGFIFALVLPKIIQKYDKFKFFMLCSILSAAFGLIIYLGGYNSRVIFIIFTILKGVPAGAWGMMLFMFTPDCAEYGKYKTGTDARGITFAIQTFTVKLSASIASSLSVFLLAFVGWKEIEAANFTELKASGVTQSVQALDGLWTIYALVPVIGLIISILILTRYKLNDKDVQIMADCNTGKITKEQAQESLSREY